MKTIEGNFLIAKVMGYNYSSANSEVFRLSYELHNYHEDWNKLIAVIKKLEGGFSMLWRDVTINKVRKQNIFNQNLSVYRRQS